MPVPPRRAARASRRPLVPRLGVAVLAAVLALGASACGNDRTEVPDLLTPGPRLGDNPVVEPRAGLRLIAPAGWTVTQGEPPLLTTVASGDLIVSIFRYPRTEPLPRTREELDRATTDLLAAAKARDPTFTPIRTARTRVDGEPAIQVRATQTVAGQPRIVRSTHVFAHGAEIVIDMLAPGEVFRQVDAATFRPLLRSIELTEPKA